MDLRERRQLNNGFGESLSRAFELALTPVVFGGVGWLLDGWLGTRPVFTLALFAFVMTYLVWNNFRRYDADMRSEEARLFGPNPKATE